MSATPRVSVCIPVYNGSNYIADAVQSVLAQTFHDFELVVQDNCSTDETLAIVRSFDDPRIVVGQNEKNVGVTGNINRAMARARGEYVRLLCHDDLLAPTCLEEQVRFLDTHPSVGIAFTWLEGIDAAGNDIGPMFHDRLVSLPEVLSPAQAALLLYSKGCSTHISSAMGRRDALTPFDESYGACGDWAKWAEASARWDIGIIRKPLTKVRSHDANLTHHVKSFHAAETYRVLAMLEPRLPHDFEIARFRRRFYAEPEFAVAVWLALHGKVRDALGILNVIRRHEPLLPVAAGFVRSRPAWIKRRLAALRRSALKASATS